jgi:hypothetical protein
LITFFVAGEPKGQPRPRAYVRGSHAGVYNPDTADGWKRAIALQAAQHAPRTQIDGPITVQLTFRMPRPKRLRRAEDQIAHVARPDIDNLVKAVLDVLTGLGFWGDDSQVSMLIAAKVYALPDGDPGVSIHVSAH